MLSYYAQRIDNMKNSWRLSFPDGEVFIIEDTESYYGLCTRGPTLVINPKKHKGRKKYLEELDTWIHEALHYIFPELDENQIAVAAGKLAAILWEAGYRRQRRSTTS